jgi:prolyl 4-hydroxylase
MTFLLYLNDPASEGAGGGTAFPKSRDPPGLSIRPGKGGAAFFYNLLGDGNPDDLSLHAAEPVLEGEKWLANVWLWDPHMNPAGFGLRRGGYS